MYLTRRAPLVLTIAAAAVGLGALVSCAPAVSTSSSLLGHGTQRLRIGGAQAWVPYNTLNGLAAVSPADVWAVGATATGRTLIERWNGRAWRQVPSPSPSRVGGGSVLTGVAVAGHSQAWAVGYYNAGAAVKTLIERWDGRAWRRVLSPSPGGSSTLAGVAVASASSAWAVGSFSTGKIFKTLIEHWNGVAWKLVGSPSPGGSRGSFLTGVAAAGSGPWAVGYDRGSTGYQTLVERWNGRAWRHVASPNPGGRDGDGLNAIATAGRSGGAWAVGYLGTAKVDQILIERWDGRAWRHVPSPRPAGSRGAELTAVAAPGSADAWAVGYYFADTMVEPAVKTLIERWNGRAWKQVASPSPGGSVGSSGDQSLLEAVSAISSSRAWAAGHYSSGNPKNTILFERWTGRAWRALVGLVP